jgi:hypothetical protein
MCAVALVINCATANAESLTEDDDGEPRKIIISFHTLNSVRDTHLELPNLYGIVIIIAAALIVNGIVIDLQIVIRPLDERSPPLPFVVLDDAAWRSLKECSKLGSGYAVLQHGAGSVIFEHSR